MKTKKYLTVGTYPKHILEKSQKQKKIRFEKKHHCRDIIIQKIVETEKKIDMKKKKKKYHTVGIHVVPKYIQKKTETISIPPTHIYIYIYDR